MDFPFMKRIVIFTLCVFITFGASGCMHFITMGSYNKDVSKKKKLWGEYRIDTDYELLIGVFFMTDWSFKPPKKILVPPRDKRYLGLMHYGAPYSVAEYNEDPDRWSNIHGVLVNGVIKSGTVIKTRYLMQKGALLWPPSLTVFAEIMDGEFKGEVVSIADLSKVSDYDSSPLLLKPDPVILRVKSR